MEANNFLDLHEEQFNRECQLFRIFEKHWNQVKPWNSLVHIQKGEIIAKVLTATRDAGESLEVLYPYFRLKEEGH